MDSQWATTIVTVGIPLLAAMFWAAFGWLKYTLLKELEQRFVTRDHCHGEHKAEDRRLERLERIVNHIAAE